jgi:hypothetical protein
MAYPDEWNDVLKERDTLRAENERLREALQKIKNWCCIDDDGGTETIIIEFAQQALNEVTNSETDYREHLRNMPESEYKRLHENRWENDENKVTK